MEDYQKTLETLQTKLSDKEKALQDSQSEVSRTEKRAQDFKAQIGEIIFHRETVPLSSWLLCDVIGLKVRRHSTLLDVIGSKIQRDCWPAFFPRRESTTCLASPDWLILLPRLFLIGHFRVPKTLTFKVGLGAQPFL